MSPCVCRGLRVASTWQGPLTGRCTPCAVQAKYPKRPYLTRRDTLADRLIPRKTPLAAGQCGTPLEYALTKRKKVVPE